MPKNPRSIELLRIRDERAEMQDGKQNFVKNRQRVGYILFFKRMEIESAFKINVELFFLMEHLNRLRNIFYQTYVTFRIFGETKIPLVWCLLQNKTTGIYRRMLQTLSRKLPRMDLQLKIREIICDFEPGFKVRQNISVTSNLDILISF